MDLGENRTQGNIRIKTEEVDLIDSDQPQDLNEMIVIDLTTGPTSQPPRLLVDLTEREAPASDSESNTESTMEDSSTLQLVSILKAPNSPRKPSKRVRFSPDVQEKTGKGKIALKRKQIQEARRKRLKRRNESSATTAAMANYRFSRGSLRTITFSGKEKEVE